MKQGNAPRKVRLEIPSNLSAVYANAVIVSQTHSEVVLDFIQIMPNDPRARIQTRVVLTPTSAKLFQEALKTNIERYEEQHGEIPMPPQSPSLADELFGGIRPGDDEGE